MDTKHLMLHYLTSHSATTEELLKPEHVLQLGNVGNEVAYGTRTQSPHPEKFGSTTRSPGERPARLTPLPRAPARS